MKNKIPHYFNEKQNVINLVIYTAIYAEWFILFFAPFKSRTWVENDWQFLFWVTVVVLVAMGVIAISRSEKDIFSFFLATLSRYCLR